MPGIGNTRPAASLALDFGHCPKRSLRLAFNPQCRPVAAGHHLEREANFHLATALRTDVRIGHAIVLR